MVAPLNPLPLIADDFGSVLAVKGSLRRFAPWTAPGRSERRAAYEGKGGMQISVSDFISHLISFDSIAPQTRAFGPCGRAEREPFGHTRRPSRSRGAAVTRRAVAQRRSRASGLTRPSAEAISDSAWTGLQTGRTSVSRRETSKCALSFVRVSVHGHESGLKMACRKDWAASAIQHPSF